MKRLLFIVLSSLLLLLALPSHAFSYQSVFVTSQWYDRGQMIWRSDTGTIFVLTHDGEVIRFPVQIYGELPPNPWRVAPLGKVPPMMGFGKIWANYDEVRAKLGWATISEVGRNSVMVSYRDGSVYMQDQLARLMQVKPDNTWQFVDAIPDEPPSQGDPVIRTFVVNPDTVKPGNTISVTWNIENVDVAIVEFYDAYPRNDILYQIQDRKPASGSTRFTVPDGVLHGITVTVHGANYDFLSNGHLVTKRVVTASEVVKLNDNDEPQEPEPIETWAVYQLYEHGMMIWRRDNGTILVLYDDGTLSTYPLTYYAYLSDAPKDLDVPEDRVAPTNGFGRVWAYLDNVRERLGWATDIETGFDLTITIIDHHLLEYDIPDEDTIYVTPDGWRYEP